MRATRLRLEPYLAPQPARGFTLVELLVVLLIILIVSAAALPTVLSGLRQRQVGEAARTLQAALGGARDAAISNNAPRGIRLLPDPVLTQPSLLTATTPANVGSTTWACNRFIPIEPASDYREGRVGFFNTAWGPYDDWSLDPNYAVAKSVYAPTIETTGITVLMLLQSYTDSSLNPVELTSWSWNIRVGDKIQFQSEGVSTQSAGAGHIYTVVGPVVTPNPEGFINYGDTGPPTPSGNYPGPAAPEFLLLVNGVDDEGDGFIDNGYDGLQHPIHETEKWIGAQISQAFNLSIMRYVAKRRPIPARGARETLLPSNVVIDLTTWNYSNQERSRLPIDGISRYIDILVDPTGQIIQSTSFSTPASYTSPFLHFWLTDREGVVAPAASSLVTTGSIFLPMPQSTPSYSTTGPFLQGERMLVTITARTGNLTNNSLQNFDAVTPDPSAPFYNAQRGVKEAQ